MGVRLAVAAGRLAGFASRLVGRGGTAVPGLVAERIDRRLIEHLVAGLPEGVVVVTGTNGKTTTTRMLVAILEHAGKRVLTNPTGSNLARGVATALIGASRRARVDADLAVFEVDEAAVRALGARLRPRLVVVTNLARDQLDRYGELDTTAAHVAAAISEAGGAVLNADDPMVAALAGPGPVMRFGAVAAIRATMPDDRSLYAGGAVRASGDPDALLVSSVAHGDGQEAVVRVGGDDLILHLAVPGAYNGYNAAAALLAASRLGVAPRSAVPALEAMPPAFGRGQVVPYRGRRVKLLLVKNPAGFNQTIRLLGDVETGASVLVAINDEHADGRDVSWLWDARVEDLAATRHRFGAGGVRSADMALRFKYAGVEAWNEPDFARALNRAVEEAAEGETVYVVPTYTAMLRFLELLLPGVKRSDAWS
ncbi:MAG TPA: MurT ligase domain-containing protein [Acidimicrobiia bacterium]